MELHRIFRALADLNRLRILDLLLEDAFCVCDLDAVLRPPQPLVSRHLAYLRNAGLVRDRRQGMRVQYSAALDTGLKSFLRQAFSSEQIFLEPLQIGADRFGNRRCGWSGCRIRRRFWSRA